ncbi:MAG: glycerophosphodiester phosphodiesterase family protein [Desulfobacterales bacterium]|jgi:glycerophosphoryl diester phosphodiesterase
MDAIHHLKGFLLMDINFWLEQWLHRVVDLLYERMPQSLPDTKKLKQCKIISHRGEHDNKMVYENTIPAFDRVNEAGVWGVEFDIRWTKDLHPVVFHDRDLQRVFKSDIKINKVTLTELKTHCKLIPTLSEVIQKYGKKMHFMVEIKKEAYPDPAYQNNVLRDLFHQLTPQMDFHFIALKPEMFDFINFVTSSTFVPSARFNVKQLSDLTLIKRYGGIAGHYLLMNDSLLKKHHTQNQCIGTGYIRSKNCLFRELNRGVEWIFSNHAIKLQNMCNSLLKLKP